MTIPLGAFIFLSFFIVGEETRKPELEIISGEVMMIDNIVYEYDRWGNLTQETKDKLSKL